MRRKLKRSWWLPAILAIYFAAMSAYFGPRLIAEGLALKFWLSVGFEVIIVVALYFALRRKERLAQKWPKSDGR